MAGETREAGVRLTLEDGQFTASLRKIGDETEKQTAAMAEHAALFGAELGKSTGAIEGMADEMKESSAVMFMQFDQLISAVNKLGEKAGEEMPRKVSAGARAMKAGFAGAKEEVGKLGRAALSATGLVAGLMGGFTVGGAVMGAVELDEKFKQIAFRVGVANGALVKHTDIQRTVERAAAKTGRRTAEMAGVFDELFKATGDSGFAGEVLETIGTMAQATGQDVATLSTLADQLHTKFGVTADQMQDTFAQVLEASTKGGPSFEEFANVASNLGAELLNAGIGGKQGLDFMLGALVQTDDAMKNLNSQTKGVKQILLSLGDKAQITALAKSLHINPNALLNEKDLMGRMRKVLGMGKKGIDALKGSMKEAEEQKALKILFTDPFEAAMKEAEASGVKGKAAIDKALGVLDAGIAKLGKSTLTGANVQEQAAERMKGPHARLTAALETLERSFASPEIIGAIDDLSQYLPQLANALGGFVKFVVKNPLLSGALGIGGAAAKGFIMNAASELIKGHIAGATAAAARIEGAHIAGGMKAGNLMSGAIGLAAIAAAGYLAKEQIDKALDDEKGAQVSSATAVAGSGGGKTVGKKREQISALEDAIARERDATSGVSGFTQDLLGGLATVAGSDVPNMRGQSESRIQEMQALIHQKELEIEALQGGKKPVAASPDGAAGGKPANVGIDGQAQRGVGKAVAEAMTSSNKPMRVLITNPPGTAGTPGPGGSRGPARPGALAPGGGY
jgi:hypothetical protein